MKWRKTAVLIVAAMTINLFAAVPQICAAGIAWPDDYGLQGKEMPFRPPQKYVSQQNPPDFSWPSVKDAVKYDLKVCRDQELKEIAYEKNGLKDNVYNFEQTFEIGTYYWSVRFYTAGGASEWSEARRFHIEPDATPFLVPPVEELVAKIPESHPRIFTTKDHLESFRATGKTQEGSEYLAKTTAEVKEAMKNPIPSEPKAEDYKNSDDLFYKLRLDDLTKTTHPMTKAAFLYMMTGDEAFGRFAIDLLVSMSKWDQNGVTSYTSQDQVHREIAYMGAMAYDWTCGLMTPAEKNTILTMIRERTKTMAGDLITSNVSVKDRPYESHGWTAFGFIMIISLSTYHDLPEAEEWMKFVLPTFLNVLPPWGNQDGGWSQGAYYYTASSPQNQLVRDILFGAGLIDIGNKAYMKNEVYFPLYCYPLGSVGAFGDNSYTAPPKQLLYMYSRMASRYGLDYAKWIQQDMGDLSLLESYNDGFPPVMDYLNIVDKYSEIKAQPPVQLPLGKRFGDIGWAAMHSDLADQNRISLFFKSSPFDSFNHSHADQNSFVIQAFGQRLAIDSGYYAYGTDWENKYVRQTFAHNGITINGGKGQTINSFLAKGSLDEFITHPDFDMVKGDAAPAYDGSLKKADRYIIYVRPDTFIVIDDLEAANAKGANFEWWLNGMENTINVYENGTGAKLTKGAAALDAQVQYPEKVQYQYSNIFSGADLVEVPRPAGKYQTSDIHQRIWFQTEKLPKTKIVTTLDVHQSSENPQYISSKQYADYVELGFENGTTAYIKTTDADMVDTGKLRFSGAGVVLNDESIMLLSGTKLQIDGQDIVSSEKPISVVSGRGLLDFSASDDTEVTVTVPGCESILDEKGRTPSAQTGAALKQDADRLSFRLDKGDYTFGINGSASKPKLLFGRTVSVTTDGRTEAIPADGCENLLGQTILHGRLQNPAGMYEVTGISEHINLANAKKGDILYLSENIAFSSYGDKNPQISLRTVDFPLYGADETADSDTLKKECSVFFEAENFVSKEGAAAKYDTRSFLSGGAGLTQLDSTDDSVTYEFEVKEAGNYRLALKFAAWNEGTQRQFILDNEAGMFTCPLTTGFGSVPDQWKGMKVKRTFHLEAGKHKLVLRGLNYNWNVDWIGFVKE